jgi:allantoin racemase
MAAASVRIALLNPNASARMTDEMVVSARQAAGALAEVQGLTNHAGPAAIQGAQDAEDCLPGLFQMFDQARRTGADAVILGCFDDTGLGPLRARGALPVIGLGEAGCLAGSLAAPRFSVVTSLAVSVPIIAANIRGMGLWARCAGVHPSGVAVLDIASGAASLAAVQAAVDGAVAADPLQSVVLGCGGMTAIAPRLVPPGTTRIIDPVVAATHMSLAALSVRPGPDP